MREHIEFEADGDLLRGWLYTPDDASGEVPTVVMAHGFSAVKEMCLDEFAEVFAGAGLGALVFDNRNFGDSEGQPRNEIDPYQQVRDYRHAITDAESRPEVDADRIGVWGTSYSGGHALTVGAWDNRVACVVSQVPLTDGLYNLRRLVRAYLVENLRERINEDRRARFRGEEPEYIPVVSEDLSADAALPTRDAYEWYTETAREHAPNWENRVTLKTLEMYSEYAPIDHVAEISPTPLRMIVAEDDTLAVKDAAFETYEKAREPKSLVTLDGGHWVPYDDAFAEASRAAREWFVDYLQP